MVGWGSSTPKTFPSRSGEKVGSRQKKRRQKKEKKKKRGGKLPRDHDSVSSYHHATNLMRLVFLEVAGS